MKRRLLKLAVIALAIAGLDQLIKLIMLSWLAEGPVTVIPGFARFVLIYNTGAAFGSFAEVDGARWILVAATFVALGLALWVASGRLGQGKAMLWALAGICGGAIGNLIDRLYLGKVVDFVDLHVGAFHWPAFNLADAAITLGGIYVAIVMIRGKV